MKWNVKAPIIVHKISFQSNLSLPNIWANSHPTNPNIEIKFENKCLFLKNQLSEFSFLNMYGIDRTNNAGIPIAGKKLGATPKRYLIIELSPL